jgi:RNase P subunit RPR2
MTPRVLCPKCQQTAPLSEVLTAQSNQNVIYTCTSCNYSQKNIQTSKG